MARPDPEPARPLPVRHRPTPAAPPGTANPQSTASPRQDDGPSRGGPPAHQNAAASAPDDATVGARPPLRAVADGERAPLTAGSPWLRTLAQAIAEALTGCRPAEPLRSVVTYDVYMTICRGRRTFRAQTYRPQLWRLRTCAIDRDHVEAAAVVRFGAEYRALALRLDRAPRGWRCTVLRVG